MAKPDWMSNADWNKCVYYANKYGTYPELLAAIGWHETHWGRLGAGKRGYHLGVSVYPPHYGLPQFQGLDKQLDWAAKRLGQYMDRKVSHAAIRSFAREVWKPGNPDAWADDVWKIYKQLGGNVEEEKKETPYLGKVVDAEIFSDLELKIIARCFTEMADMLKKWVEDKQL